MTPSERTEGAVDGGQPVGQTGQTAPGRSRGPAGAVVAHDTSRGVALYGDKVYFAAGEAVLVALDARTGKEVWTTDVADSKAAYYITLAPLVAGGKVMVGASGGEFGIRGFVAAFDPETAATYPPP